MSKLSLVGAVLGSLSVPSIAHAELVLGSDLAGMQTGTTLLQLGAGELSFIGSSYSNSPAYSYRTNVSTGPGTELVFGPALDAGTLIDASLGFASGTETLQDSWQSGYMGYSPGGGGCSRYSCWSYPGYYYPVVTGSGLSGAWAGQGSGYLGFRFLADGWHYGWVEMVVDAEQYDVVGWAYETVSDVGVIAGAERSEFVTGAPSEGNPEGQRVPEPSTLALLALGFSGLAVARARRLRVQPA